MKGLVKRYTDEQISEILKQIKITYYGKDHELTDSKGVSLIWTWRVQQDGSTVVYQSQSVRKRVYDGSLEPVQYESTLAFPAFRLKIVDAFHAPLYPGRSNKRRVYHPPKRPKTLQRKSRNSGSS